MSMCLLINMSLYNWHLGNNTSAFPLQSIASYLLPLPFSNAENAELESFGITDFLLFEDFV